MNIDQLLEAYNANTLFAIVQANGLSEGRGKKPNKIQVMELLKAKLFTSGRIQKAVEKLSPLEKNVLNRLLLHEGEVPTRLFKRELNRAGLLTPTPEGKQNAYGGMQLYTASLEAGSTVFEDLIARLTQAGLVFTKPDLALLNTSNPPKLQFDPGDVLIIPPFVRHFLPPAEPLPANAPELAPAHIQKADPHYFLRELYLYWDFVRRNPVPLLQSGLVGKRSLRPLSNALLTPDTKVETAGDETDTEKLYPLRQLLQGLELLTNAAGRLAVKPTQAPIPPFWRLDTTQQMGEVLRVWLGIDDTTPFDYLVRSYRPQGPRAHRVLVQGLQQMTTAAWFELEDLLERLITLDPDFLFSERSNVERQRGSYYYYSGSYAGAPKELLKAFDLAERQFVEHAFNSFLLASGVLELGSTAANVPWQVARITPFGAAVLKSLDLTAKPVAGQARKGSRSATSAQAALAETNAPYTAAEGSRIVVQPNFQILAMGPVSLAMLAELDRFAERQKADIGVFEYTLTRDSVYNAQQTGLNVAEIVAFLQTTSGTPLPQNVQRSLDEWGAHHERIVFRPNVTLLQAADDHLLAALLEHAETGKHLARAVAPGVALVKSGRQAKLVDALLQQNLPPALSDDKPSAADHSVIITSDGLVRPIHAVPSLHLTGRLARLAEPENGGWRITPNLVRKVGGSRQKVLNIIEELNKLQRGGLPPALVEQVKQWGAYYGEARAETVTLLEFRDAQALAELRQRPDLEALLTPFPAGERALALVPAKRLAEVKKLLQALGVTVQDGLAR